MSVRVIFKKIADFYHQKIALQTADANLKNHFKPVKNIWFFCRNIYIIVEEQEVF